MLPSPCFQLKELRRGVEIVVGTPGRIIDLIDQDALDLSFVSCCLSSVSCVGVGCFGCLRAEGNSGGGPVLCELRRFWAVLLACKRANAWDPSCQGARGGAEARALPAGCSLASCSSAFDLVLTQPSVRP